MKLYLISQDVNNKYDTYDSAVVMAENEEEARKIHPNSDSPYFMNNESVFDDWTSPENVKVEYIGEAREGLKYRVVCASFNAG